MYGLWTLLSCLKDEGTGKSRAEGLCMLAFNKTGIGQAWDATEDEGPRRPI